MARPRTQKDLIIEANKDHEKSKEMLKNSHDKVIGLIATFFDEELFIKQYFDWTGTSSLDQYGVSTTVAHYDWVIKKIKAHKK